MNGFNYNDKEQARMELLNKMNSIGDNNIRKAAAGASLAKNAVGLGILIYILASENILKALSRTEDKIMQLFAGGMKVMLIAMAVCLAAGTIQSLISLIILIKGDEDTGFGRIFLIIAETVRSSAGYVILGVMGILFACMGAFSILAPEDMKNGDPKTFLIVGGVFVVAGLGMLIAAIVNIVKEIRYALEDAANPIVPGGF